MTIKGAIGGLVCALVGIMLGISLSVSSAQSPLYAGCSTVTASQQSAISNQQPTRTLAAIFKEATQYAEWSTSTPGYNSSTALAIIRQTAIPPTPNKNVSPTDSNPTPTPPPMTGEGNIYRALYGMNIRGEPSVNAVIRGSVSAGTLVRVNAEVRNNAGTTWRGVNAVLIGETWVNTEGWMAERMLIGSARSVYLEVVP